MTYQWQPTVDYLDSSNVARLMRRLSVDSVDALRSASVADVAAFWATVVDDLGIPFSSPFGQVLDTSRGIEWPQWFPGARLNAAEASLMRWATIQPDAAAVIHEDESGASRTLSYTELQDEVARMRAALRRLGVAKGDVVAMYLPMIPEAVVATYAIAGMGAIAVPLFSGFSSTAIASRLQDAGARVVVTADGTYRRGRASAMLPQLRVALEQCPEVTATLVVNNLREAVTLRPSEHDWSRLRETPGDAQVEDTDASDTLLIAYTSGTTGKPKGAVHTHAGFMVKTACELAYGFEIGPGRILSWVTDMGWIMGPLSVFGTHANGGTLLLYEGSPDAPDVNRLWRLVEGHRISTLGVSPTLIRTLRASASTPSDLDLSSLRVIGSTGEPWDPQSYDWLAATQLDGRVPIINFSGGTEVGGSFLCPYPAESIASCSLGGPALGMDVDVVNDQGESVRGEIGELVCRQPWPSMTRGLWKDPERYLEAYWSTLPGLWRHGDFALAEEGGAWFILGRSDDVMNVAGKRVAPAEIESIVAVDPAVSESAVVGIPDPTKGEAIWVFYVRRPGCADADADITGRVRASVAAEIGKPFTPSRVLEVVALPKTRSAKIMRRAIRAAVLDADPGDLSGAENPEAVDHIRAQVRQGS
jgi:acetyl-CoA synthetase